MTELIRRWRKKRGWQFKSSTHRAKWRHEEDGPGQVRGTNRQVIVVRSPDPEVFEEAIFVLREDRMKNAGAQQVLEEARRAADAYIRRSCAPERKRRGRLWLGIFAAAGILASGAVWAAFYFIGL